MVVAAAKGMIDLKLTDGVCYLSLSWMQRSLGGTCFVLSSSSLIFYVARSSVDFCNVSFSSPLQRGATFLEPERRAGYMYYLSLIYSVCWRLLFVSLSSAGFNSVLLPLFDVEREKDKKGRIYFYYATSSD